jgi:hypothetical protein
MVRSSHIPTTTSCLHRFPRNVPRLHKSSPDAPFCAAEQLTSIHISSSSARLLHSGFHYLNLASFVLGPNCAPFPSSAAFSCVLAAYSISPCRLFSFPGLAGCPGHPLSFCKIIFSSTGPDPRHGASVGAGGGDLFGSSHGVRRVHQVRNKWRVFWRDLVEGRRDNGGAGVCDDRMRPVSDLCLARDYFFLC